MDVTMNNTNNILTSSLIEDLIAIPKPTNAILLRLQEFLKNKKNFDVISYSRMHNRHNRS